MNQVQIRRDRDGNILSFNINGVIVENVISLSFSHREPGLERKPSDSGQTRIHVVFEVDHFEVTIYDSEYDSQRD